MPSKIVTEREVCFPCKYHRRDMWKSGMQPIYQYFCEHPSMPDSPEWGFVLTQRAGRYIGDTDEQPSWCPLTPEEAKAMSEDID